MSLFPADPYFDSVSLLVPFDGENGDTTSTDLSNSAHTLTFGGTAALDGDIRKFGVTSLILDGDSDYVDVPTSTEFDFGTGTFTIELHFRLDTLAKRHALITKYGSTLTTTADWGLIYETSGTFGDERDEHLRFVWSTNGTTVQDLSLKTGTIAANTWYHVAVCRDDAAFPTDGLAIFLDGIKQTPSTIGLDSIVGDDVYYSSEPIHIGKIDPSAGNKLYVDGNIENVRITKGVARYTGDFRPPRGPHPTRGIATDNPVRPGDPYFDDVVLLVPCDGENGDTTTPDFSNEKHTMTFAANASLDSSERKFGSTSCLIDNTDGKGVYTPTSAAWANLKIADGFTVEAHVNYSVTGTNTLVSMWSWTQGSTTRSWGIFLGSDGGVDVWTQNSASSATHSFGSATGLLTADTWHHVVFQCQPAGNFEVFVDGTRVVNVAPSISELRDPTDDFCIGATDDSVDELDGYVENVRITKGIARYPESFRPPRGPHPTRSR